MSAPRPFAGLRVVDLGTFWAGPFLGCYLASLGADVVKVEGTRRVDGFRFVAAFPEQGERWYEQSGLFQATNLGKRDVAVDLEDPEGRALVAELLDGADVVIENFSPRVVEHFGFDHRSLAATNPGVILLRMPGFGLEGPWRDFVGFGNSFEYAGGIGAVTGHPDGPPLGPGGYADPLVAVHGAVALTAALEERERTGRGAQVEIVQIEVVAAMTPEPPITWSLTGEVPGRLGNRDPEVAPQGVYPAADGWVALTVRDDEDWRRLVGALGEPAWSPPGALDRTAERRARHDDLDRWLAAWTTERGAADAVRCLAAAGLPAATVLEPAGMYDDPQLVATRYYQELDHPVSGPRRYPTWPFRWGPERTRVGHRRRAPLLGEHVDEVLVGELGRSPEEVARLRAEGVVGDHVPATNDEGALHRA